jgi:hypothetical protein
MNQQAVEPQAKTTGRASSLQVPTGAGRHPRPATPSALQPPRSEHAPGPMLPLLNMLQTAAPPSPARNGAMDLLLRRSRASAKHQARDCPRDPALAHQAQIEPSLSQRQDPLTSRGSRRRPPGASHAPQPPGRLLILPQTWIQGRCPGFLFPAGDTPHAPASPIARALGPPHPLRR